MPLRRRALVVDDDPIMRSLSRARLSRIVDDVVEAADGLEAWRLLTTQRFHLALVDLMMPNLNGFALIQCMRGHPRTRHMPIIVVSSSDDKGSIEKALEVGASSFVTKPVLWPTFSAHVEHLMRLSTSAKQAEADFARQLAISKAQGQLLGAMAAHSHACLRRMEQMAKGLGEGTAGLERIAAEAASAQVRLAELRACQNLIAGAANGDAPVAPLLRSIDAAMARIGPALVLRQITVTNSCPGGIEVCMSPGAMTYVAAAALSVVGERAETGASLHLGADPAGEALVIRLTLERGTWMGIEDEEAEADLAFAGSLPQVGTSFSLALARTVLAAHNGSLRVVRAADAPVAIEIHLPADRCRDCTADDVTASQSLRV